MTWIMSSYRSERPIEYTYFIGEVPVAAIYFVAGKARLALGRNGAVSDHAKMPDALKEMHRALSAPAPVENKIGRTL
jgi:hypothetical protein